jgi:hypothetical protein
MKYYYRHPEEISTEDESKNESEKMILSILSKEFNAAVVDRTGNLNTFVENMYPLPAPSIEKLDFNLLMDERAEEIVEYAVDKGKKIRFEWNGLMTQTASLLSIIRYITDKENMPELTVFVVGKADTKRPDFYKKWIENNELLNVQHVTNMSNRVHMKSESGLDYITVNDAGGQNLFSVGYMTFSDHTTPFKDICEPEFYEIIKPILDKMPEDWNNEDPLTTTYTSSALHWLNFVLKWQWVSLKRFIKSPLEFDDIKCFYHTDKFQQWFYQVPPLGKHVDLMNKKSHWHCRQYIWQYHDDESMQQCQYVTGRSYRNMESQQTETNPILHKGKYCVGIDETFGKHWRDKGDIQFEVIEDDNETLAS